MFCVSNTKMDFKWGSKTKKNQRWSILTVTFSNSLSMFGFRFLSHKTVSMRWFSLVSQKFITDLSLCGVKTIQHHNEPINLDPKNDVSEIDRNGSQPRTKNYTRRSKSPGSTLNLFTQHQRTNIATAASKWVSTKQESFKFGVSIRKRPDPVSPRRPLNHLSTSSSILAHGRQKGINFLD